MCSKGYPEGRDGYLDYLRGRGLYEKFREEFPKPSTLDENDYMDGFFTAKALEWLGSYRDEKPFFLWVNYSCPHGPYDVHQKYIDRYRAKDMPDPIVDSYEGVPEGLVSLREKKSKERVKQGRAQYAGTVAFVDRQVERIVEGLEKTGKLEDTIIVFFSDHGIMTGDHGLKGKGTLWEEVTNPSLIVSYPKGFRTGTVVTDPVELLDLPKTCLDVTNRFR